MLRLTQRAWNNVLIVTMISLIVVFNFEKFTWEDDLSARLVVPEGEYILSMNINGVDIQKAGQQWRISPNGLQINPNPSAEALAAIVRAWQTFYISPANIPFDLESFASPQAIVTIALAGDAKPVVVAFNVIEQQLLVVINKQVFIVNSPSISALLEPIVRVKR